MATVRRLGRDEWVVLRTVRLRALLDAPYAFGSTFEEESQRSDTWWKSSLERVGWRGGVTPAWFVAEHEGDLVGLVAGIPAGTDCELPEIISMWVRVEERGLGLADQLLEAVVSWARTEGAPAVSLGVADGNDRARKFYEKAGFVATGHSEPLRSRPSIRTREMRLAL